MKWWTWLAPIAALYAVSGPAVANEWVHGLDVLQVGTYQSDVSHFVWFSALPQECRSQPNPVMGFREDRPGGKALYAALMTALVSKRKVDLQASGCEIVEIYVK